MDILEIIDILKHKGSEWTHENEYRAVYYAPEVKDSLAWIEKESSSNIYLRLPVKSVTFGVNSHKDDDYVDAIECILDFNRKNGTNVLINRVKKSLDKYELIDNKQFDVNAELKKYKRNN